MRRVLAVLVVALAAVAAGAPVSAPAGSNLIGCFGAPPEYIAAFDTAGGQSKNGQVDYAEQRWYKQDQTWATHALETPGHHSEHQHFGACVPNALTVASVFRLDVQYTFHNMQDYTIVSAGESAVSKSGSMNVWSATPAQVAQLQAAADASCPTCANNVQNVFFSVTTTPPTSNGFKEIRGAVATVKNGDEAVFLQWNTDVRWYLTYAFPGLASSEPLGNQLAARVRPIVNFPKSGDPTVIKTDYHHSGVGCDPGTSTTKPSYLWTRQDVASVWRDGIDHKVCLRVTDGGGPAMLMIDPDFHHHYTEPTAACPNVDANGNCLGKWFWQPANTRKEMFGLVNQDVVIPASVIDSLSPGVHVLAFKSDDFAECFRATNFTNWGACPSDVRGTWSNVSRVPFRVQ